MICVIGRAMDNDEREVPVEEISGEGYTRDLYGDEATIDGDDITWDSPSLKVTWILHPEYGPISISSKPDPGDSRTHKLLEQIIDRLEQLIGTLNQIHQGIK